MESTKRLAIIFLPWALASVCIYVAAYMDHLRFVQLAAFVALLLSALFFVLSHRPTDSQRQLPTKYGVRISAWATILAGVLYLVLSGWWR